MQRLGRFLVLVARDGTRHALAAGAVAAICEDADGGTTLLLPGGRHVVTDIPLHALAAALSTPAVPLPAGSE